MGVEEGDQNVEKHSTGIGLAIFRPTSGHQNNNPANPVLCQISLFSMVFSFQWFLAQKRSIRL